VEAFRGQKARGEAPDNNTTAVEQGNGWLEAAGQKQRRDCLEACAQVPTRLRSFARARGAPTGWTLATVLEGAKTLLKHPSQVTASHRHRLKRLSRKCHCPWLLVPVSMSPSRQLPDRTRPEDNTALWHVCRNRPSFNTIWPTQ
jgi:hypothetical protein